MRRVLEYLTAALLLLSISLPAIAANKGEKNFANHQLVRKGEFMAGASVMYASMNSDNSEFLLLMTGATASGSVFRAAPYVSYAYRDNASIGVRFDYSKANAVLDNVNLGLLSDDLTVSVKGLDAVITSYGAGLYHRNYFGFDKGGNIGMFLELRAQYSHNDIHSGQAAVNGSDKLQLVFAPGVLMYILPFVSLDASIGIADFSYVFSAVSSQDPSSGSFKKMGGGVGLNLLNCNFAVSFHF